MADAFLSSADPKMVNFDDVSGHLAQHRKLYWTVGYAMKKETIVLPLWAYIHVKGERVRYRMWVTDVLPFSPEHYENAEFKPMVWLERWRNNPQGEPRTTTLVITKVEAFDFDTLQLQKVNGRPVKHPPQNYVRIFDPGIQREAA